MWWENIYYNKLHCRLSFFFSHFSRSLFVSLARFHRCILSLSIYCFDFCGCKPFKEKYTHTHTLNTHNADFKCLILKIVAAVNVVRLPQWIALINYHLTRIITAITMYGDEMTSIGNYNFQFCIVYLLCIYYNFVWAHDVFAATF